MSFGLLSTAFFIVVAVKSADVRLSSAGFPRLLSFCPCATTVFIRGGSECCNSVLLRMVVADPTADSERLN
jgi:hypothetical protein